jgi:hypothetical protein
MKINLPIFFHTDNTSDLLNLSIDYKLSDCEIRQVTFYVINAIAPYIEDGKVYTTIHSNGDNFVCPLNIKEVEKIINENTNVYVN